MTRAGRFVIKVPSSTANLGPGFDSIGLALNLYLTLEVEENEKWEFISVSTELKGFPTDETHFIAQIALKTARKYGVNLPPCKVRMTSEIPLARGLGSSAAAIIAGIELADIVGRLGLTQKEKLLIATEVEGHPDNVGASLMGGLVVGSYQKNGHVDVLSFSNVDFEAVTVIPNEILLTKDSREILPTQFSRENAVQASSTANLLVASLLTGEWELAGKMMGQDLFHQPYRKPLIASYSEVEKVAKENGAFGVALSGAGPTLICFVERETGSKLTQELKEWFPNMTVKRLTVDYQGSCVKQVEEFVR